MRHLLLVALLLQIPALAQNPLNDVARAMKTGMDFNGRFWNAQTPEAKAMYLFGVMESAAEIVMHAPDKCVCVLQASSNFVKALFGVGDPTPREMIEELDAFFKEPSNRPVPIVKALRYTALKMSGGTRAQLEELESSLTGCGKYTLPASISGLTAAARATLPPSGVTGRIPGSSRDSIWITADPFALSAHVAEAIAAASLPMLFEVSRLRTADLASRSTGWVKRLLQLCSNNR